MLWWSQFLGPGCLFLMSWVLLVCCCCCHFRALDVWSGGAIVKGVHVGDVLAYTVLQSSPVRSSTRIYSFVFSCWRRSYSFSIYAVSVFVIDRVRCVSRVSIFCVKLYFSPVICWAISGVIPSSKGRLSTVSISSWSQLRVFSVW